MVPAFLGDAKRAMDSLLALVSIGISADARTRELVDSLCSRGDVGPGELMGIRAEEPEAPGKAHRGEVLASMFREHPEIRRSREPEEDAGSSPYRGIDGIGRCCAIRTVEAEVRSAGAGDVAGSWSPAATSSAPRGGEKGRWSSVVGTGPARGEASSRPARWPQHV